MPVRPTGTEVRPLWPVPASVSERAVLVKLKSSEFDNVGKLISVLRGYRD